MKLRTVILAGGVALLAASCSNPSAKSLKESGATTPMDSINYLLGEQYATSYQQLVARDSVVFDTDKARNDYIKGMLDALSSLKEGNDAYNEGYTVGVQLASNVLRTQNEVGDFHFDKKLFGTGLAAGMDKKIEETPDAASIINRLMNELYTKQTKKDDAQVKKDMGDYAKKNGMKAIAGGEAYIKVVKPGEGATIAEGDSVQFTMDVKSDQGKDLSAYASKDNTVVIGQTLPAQHPYYQALTQMKSGESAIVVMPAKAVYGNYLQQIGLKPTSYLIVGITAKVLGKGATAVKE